MDKSKQSNKSKENTKKPNRGLIIALGVTAAVLVFAVAGVFIATSIEKNREPEQEYISPEEAALKTKNDLIEARIDQIRYYLHDYALKNDGYPVMIETAIKNTTYLDEYNVDYQVSPNHSGYELTYTDASGKRITRTEDR